MHSTESRFLQIYVKLILKCINNDKSLQNKLRSINQEIIQMNTEALDLRSNMKLCHLPYFSTLFDHNYHFHFQSKRFQIDRLFQWRENDSALQCALPLPFLSLGAPLYKVGALSISFAPDPDTESTTVTNCTHLRLSTNVNLTALRLILSNLMSNLLI